MLEEALRNEKSHPGETALAMLSFLESELSAGGPAAEARFLNLYTSLCERIFGTVLGADNGFRHKDGGWFSYTNTWQRPSTVLLSPRGPLPNARSPLHRSESSPDTDPVIKLLGKSMFSTSLLDAMSNLSDSRPSVGFAFPFLALPKQMQDTWLALLEESMGGTSVNLGSHPSLNDVRLIGTILRKRPSDQNQLRHYKQLLAQKHDVTRQPVHLSPRGFVSSAANVPTPMRTSPRQAAVVPPDQNETEPNVMMTVLEHYLFLFLRFPLFVPDKKVTAVSSIPGVNVHRIAAPPSAVGRTQGTRAPEPFGERIYLQIFRSSLNHFLPYERDSKRSITLSSDDYESELFLRILMSFWLDSMANLLPTAKVVHSILERRQHAGLDDSTLTSVLDLNASYDLVQLTGTYDAPPALVYRCLHILIGHAVTDPLLHRYSQDAVTAKQNWRLTPCMTVLQYPFYNYIRTSFRYATVHSHDSPFYYALELWLTWCEPWKLTRPVARKSASSPQNSAQRLIDKAASMHSARVNRLINYTASWDPFIAANAYMYAVPLAIFLRRARELDFSGAKFHRSMDVVQKVFRVFSPQLVDALAFQLESRQSSTLSPLLKSHIDNLGPFAPPVESTSLQSLKADMQSLMEEIDLQRSLKKERESNFFDKWMMGPFESVVSGGDKAVTSLSERAKVIARLPVNYDLLSQKSKHTGSKGSLDHKRDYSIRSNGKLTKYGTEQVLLGFVNCRPEDIPYDPARVRARGHEIAYLVKLTSWASDILNERLCVAIGRKYDESVRFINLRFLADYRVHLVLVAALFGQYAFQYTMMLLVQVTTNYR